MPDKLNFDEIKRIPMEDVLRRYNVQLFRSAKGSTARCPLPTHKKDDRDKNFSVNLEGNYWRCFSASCNQGNGGKRGGDVINFVALMEHCRPREAAEKLAEWFGMKKEPVHIEPAHPPHSPTSNGHQNSKPVGDSVKPKRYMEEIDEWFDQLIVRPDGEDDQAYWKRIRNGFKARLIESFRNGKAAVQLAK